MKDAKQRGQELLKKSQQMPPLTMATVGKLSHGDMLKALSALKLNLPEDVPSSVELIDGLREAAGYSNTPRPKKRPSQHAA